MNLENFTVSSSTNVVGTLIADIRGSASIDNVHIIGGTVDGYKDIGGLAGRLYGYAETNDDLVVVTISNTSNSAAVTATNTSAGGIIG
ncbi:MAG TPA: hypothetical protein EYO04_02615, partial [Candidatus Marinimicrobia bacterium]|nr:hypothetical protein [Candidatus Neomarinimicrobiota bacterium]